MMYFCWQNHSNTDVAPDSERPIIENCPATITVFTDDSSDDVTVSWDLPTVTDNYDSSVIVNQTTGLPPGSQFSANPDDITTVTTVTYEASDDDGNEAIPCTFQIIVQSKLVIILMEINRNCWTICLAFARIGQHCISKLAHFVYYIRSSLSKESSQLLPLFIRRYHLLFDTTICVCPAHHMFVELACLRHVMWLQLRITLRSNRTIQCRVWEADWPVIVWFLELRQRNRRTNLST